MKKILIIHETLRTGGAERVLVDILKHFDYTKYRVDLMLQFCDGPFMADLAPEVSVIPIYKTPKYTIAQRIAKKLFRRAYQGWEYRRLHKLLSGKRYDAIISFMEGPAALYHSFIRELAPRNITWVHTDINTNGWHLKYFAESAASDFYRSVDMTVTVSHGVLNAFRTLYPDAAPATVLYNIADPAEICRKAAEKSIQKSRFTITNVARLMPVKQQKRIVQIARIFKNRGIDAEFWIIGNGPEKPALEALIEQSGVGDMVKLLGYQSNPNAYVAASDIALLTSDAEGYPMAIVEALSMGKPIVATDVVGPHEMLSDGSGILCDTNVESLAEALIGLMNDPLKMRELSQRALAKSESFNPERTMEAIYRLIEG